MRRFLRMTGIIFSLAMVVFVLLAVVRNKEVSEKVNLACTSLKLGNSKSDIYAIAETDSLKVTEPSKDNMKVSAAGFWYMCGCRVELKEEHVANVGQMLCID